jgi:hypothetical protein
VEYLMKLIVLSMLFAFGLVGADPATKPADDASAPSALEVRAHEEFNRAKWGSALPMLKKVAQQLRDSGQTDRLGSIEENIRVCEKNLKTAAGAQQPDASTTSNDKRKPHPAPVAGQTLEIAIKDLGNFDYDADNGGNIPDDVKHLSGATVRLSGFMIPMDQADSISQFALVPSLFSCCLGQPPQVQHTIVVHVPKGKNVSYYPDEISVEGKLTVDEKKEDGFIVSIFEVECSSVKPAAK